ncbi:MAG: ShlB/FhaC/HecB family hemolysin secretion/activation protein [Phycisphaeraceae bacterium]|nr:ShlB/FhaC/HecB family hemolysin secretion/activation protein [Phycisphaeraceae bacterium]
MRGTHRTGVLAGAPWMLGGAALLLSIGAVPMRAMAQPDEPVELYEFAQPEDRDGQKFAVGPIALVYADTLTGPVMESRPGHPDLTLFDGVEIELLQTSDGYVAPRPGVPTVTLTLAEINAGAPRDYYASAILAIANSIVREFRRQGVIGTFVVPEEINLGTGGDLRQAGNTGLTMRILTSRVTRLRTDAFGERVPTDDRIDNPVHTPIKRNSPIQPATDEGEDTSLLNKNALDRYVLWLNRHAGRRVDVAIASDRVPGTAVLDFMVQESKPWSVYFQLSNTGTENTNEWRERFGLIHNQLMGNDDTLLIDYITSGFDSSNAIVASYEAPFGDLGRTRWRVFGSWNEFTASDVGLADETFSGDGWSVGASVIHNIYQGPDPFNPDSQPNLFVDLFGSVRYHEVSTSNDTISLEGSGAFWFPQLGVTVERASETASFNATVDLEAGFTGDDQMDLEPLGRLEPDDSWVTLNWDGSYTFFLEPLLFGDAWADPNDSSVPHTLAHELALTLSGQYAFDFRLVPNFESVVGGASTVRGYPESIVAADSVVVASAEYRFHVPRAFDVDPNPTNSIFGRPFKVAPQEVWGRPDWDLVLSAFVDIARTMNSDKLGFEADETLVGAGVGAEVSIYRNVFVSVDWGFALSDVGDEVDSGDSEFHFILTLLY